MWGRFFFGTPRRLLWTLAGVLVLIAMISPQTANAMINRVLSAFTGPLVNLALLGLVCWGIATMLGIGRRGRH